MTHKTWASLEQNSRDLRAYQKDVGAALQNLDLDWADVMRELGDKLYDNREWAGLINVVDGRPKIVDLRPSPYAIGEGPDLGDNGAYVPAELVGEIQQRPALFFFHTHPGEQPGSAFPSGEDVAASLNIAYSGRYAADLMISPYGVFLYGPGIAFRESLWEYDNPARQSLVTMQRSLDVLGAMMGMRSWKSPWRLSDLSNLLRRYGVEYVVFPTFKYANAYYRRRLVVPMEGKNAEIARMGYSEEISALTAEIEAGEAVKPKGRGPGRSKK